MNIDILKAIYGSLNTIPVHGIEDCSKMAACLRSLNEFITKLNNGEINIVNKEVNDE